MPKKVYWTHEDEEMCPYGHPKAVCERRIRQGTYIRKQCAIKLIERRDEESKKEAGRVNEIHNPRESKAQEDIYVDLQRYGTPMGKTYPKYIIHLMCNHVTYQKTLNFTLRDLMYC